MLTADVAGTLTFGMDLSVPTAPAFFTATAGTGAELSVTASLNRPNFTAPAGWGSCR